MKPAKLLAAITACIGIVTAVDETAAQSDPVAAFYKGKTVNAYIGVGVGGEYDLQARLIAKYLGRHIPGNPNVVPQNMTGASGLKMLNFLYNQAPRDGTAIGMIQNGFPAAQAIGRPGIQFDANKLQWLGTIAPVVETMAIWHTADVRTLDDARKKELVVGATARGGITFTYPALMNDLLGTKFKIVTGYPGSTEILLALERGEVHGFCGIGWTFVKLRKGNWLAEKKINLLFQMALKKHPDIPDVPAVIDFAKSPQDRQVIEFLFAPQDMGRPFFAPPGVPPARVAALRAAFAQTLKDANFLEEAQRQGVEVQLVPGEEIQKLVERIYASPKEVVARAKAVVEP
jgi:tripartite-type tricarboxylate transporter receptor subunit TctC